MDSGLAGRHVLVTGASGGIGDAIARAFLAEGARLSLHAHRGEERLRRNFAAELAADRAHTRLQVATADLRLEHEVDDLFRSAREALGRIDVLVVNAGVWVMQDVPIESMTLAQWNDTLAVDLTGPFLCCRAFFRHLRDEPREEASVVMIGSTAGLFGEAGHCDYAAAKSGALVGLLKSLKNEIVRLCPRGRVNGVAPGWVRTAMTESLATDPRHVERATRTMALRKLATVEDIARATVVLASPELCGHVTGSVLPVAGGMEGRTLHAAPGD